MAIECPRCGRHYDVTLFQFGRTIHCTCGARVGRDVMERPVDRGAAARFLCDAMLGRLARWLRALGLDAAFDPDIDDAALVRWAVDEGRVVLTRDRSLPEEWRVSGCVVVASDDPLEQLREVAERFDLTVPGPLFSRCLECNEPLERAPAEAVERRVPERVRDRQREFRRCPACGRVYWEGSHTRRMRRALARALPGRAGTPGEPRPGGSRARAGSDLSRGHGGDQDDDA